LEERHDGVVVAFADVKEAIGRLDVRLDSGLAEVRAEAGYGNSVTAAEGRHVNDSTTPVGRHASTYACRQRTANRSASSVGASAQTLPPNPAPTPDAAKAPWS
jgi:hypothetical protein